VPVVVPHSMRGLHSTIAVERGATGKLVASAIGPASFERITAALPRAGDGRARAGAACSQSTSADTKLGSAPKSHFPRGRKRLGVEQDQQAELKRDRVVTVVRGGGLEPPWLLTASTSRDGRGPDGKVSVELERLETSGNVTEGPILGTCAQNPGAASEWKARVRALLAQAIETWSAGAAPRDLRRQLLHTIDTLDDGDSQ
jgi:hypothetical protein